MIRNSITHKEVGMCEVCKTPLIEFAAYLPDKGEVCMNCWVEYAKRDEANNPLFAHAS